MADRRFSRRDFLKAAGVGVGSMVLAACGSAPNAPGSTGEQQSPAQQGAASSGGKTKRLQYYIGFGAGGAPDQVTAVQKLLDKFVAASATVAGVEVLVVPHDEAPRKFQTMVAGGTPPDVITMGMSQWDFAVKGSFTDIRPLADQAKLDLAQWDQSAITAYTVAPRKDMLYGLPFGLNTQGIVYNKTLFKKLGVEPPPKDWNDKSWTWDSFIEKAKQLTTGEGTSKTWGTIGIGGNWNLPWAYGGAWVGDDLRNIMIDADPAMKGFQLNYDLIHTHKVMPTVAEAKLMTNGFLSGQVGMNVDGTWAAGTLAQIKDFEWDLAPIPWAAGTDIQQRATPYYPDALVISSKDNVQESWELIRFLILDDANYKEFLTIMNMVPARKEHRDWFVNEFWKKEQPEINWDAFLNGFNYAQVQRLFFNLNWSEINNTQQADLDPVWLGNTTPGDEIPQLDKKLQDIWTRGVEQVKAMS